MTAPAVHTNTAHKKSKEKQKHIQITKKENNNDKVLKQTK